MKATSKFLDVCILLAMLANAIMLMLIMWPEALTWLN